MAAARYRIEWADAAVRGLERLPQIDAARVTEKVGFLATSPRPSGGKKLKGTRSPALYRIRIGDYRATYTVDDRARVVTVHAVKHRREIYKDL